MIRGIKAYFNVFITKFLLFAPVVGITMPLFSRLNTGDTIMAAFLAAAASFLTSDLLVYSRYGNLPAVVADVFITAAVLLVMSYMAGTTISVTGLIFIAALIAVGEWYYHLYLAKALSPRKR